MHSGNVQDWLNDWSRLAETADEQYWRFNIATTVNTADPIVEGQFNKYIEEMQPLIKTAEQKLKDRLLASGLSPSGFETALRMMQAEADIFKEESLPLLAEEQKLVAEYSKIRGSMTVMWEGKERTFGEMVAMLYETDRSTRQRALGGGSGMSSCSTPADERFVGKAHAIAPADRRAGRHARFSRLHVEAKIPL